MRLLLPIAAALLASACASTAEEQPHSNGSTTSSSASASAYDVPEGEVRLVPRAVGPKRSSDLTEVAGPVHSAGLEPASPAALPAMPAWHPPASPACHVAAATHHDCPSGFERRLVCASSENLPSKCQVVSTDSSSALSVCCSR